jgi:hypothetical protein
VLAIVLLCRLLLARTWHGPGRCVRRPKAGHLIVGRLWLDEGAVCRRCETRWACCTRAVRLRQWPLAAAELPIGRLRSARVMRGTSKIAAGCCGDVLKIVGRMAPEARSPGKDLHLASIQATYRRHTGALPPGQSLACRLGCPGQPHSEGIAVRPCPSPTVRVGLFPPVLAACITRPTSAGLVPSLAPASTGNSKWG